MPHKLLNRPLNALPIGLTLFAPVTRWIAEHNIFADIGMGKRDHAGAMAPDAA